MAWAGGVWDGTYGTNISKIANGVNTYYDKKFLKRAINTLVFAPLGQQRDLPKGTGKTIEFFRYNNIATSVSGSILTEGTNPVPTAITGQKIQATVSEWGAFSQHSRLLKATHIDRELAGVAELWGENAGNTVDLIAHMASVCTGAYPYRCDGSNTGADAYSYSGVTSGASTSTTLVSTGLGANTNFGDGTDDCNQSIVVITSGTGYGQARPCTDYAVNTITVAPAWDVTPATGDGFVVVSPHGLTTSHLLTTTNIRNAMVILRNNKATPFSGGSYVGVLSPQTEASLMADTNWVTVMSYRDRPAVKVNGLFAGEVGEWGGVRWIRETQPFRFPIESVGTAGEAGGPGSFVPGTSYTNYSATGAVYANMILGQESFGTTTFKGNGNIMKPGIITKTPGPGDTSNPLDMFSTVGWYLPYIAKGLNPMFAVQMWSGA